MEVIQLTKDRLKNILDLETSSAPDKPFYSKYDETALNFIFDNPTTCKAFGIFKDNKLIGWGCYRTQWKDENIKEGVYEISSIVVHKDFRQQGFGKLILNKIIEDIQTNQNFKEIYLTVYPKNLAPLFLYLKSGFIIYNYKKDVYGSGSDRLYLHLINS